MTIQPEALVLILLVVFVIGFAAGGCFALANVARKLSRPPR